MVWSFWGISIWGWIVIVVEAIALALFIGAFRAIKKRAEQLGMPVSGKDKIGVITILWGKNVWLKYTPTIDNNTVEIELNKDKGVKGVWSVEDLLTRPVKGLYGLSAALLTYDVAHALDPELDKELALIENAKAPKEVKQKLIELIERLYTLTRNIVHYEALVKKYEEEGKDTTDEALEAKIKLDELRAEVEKIEKELSKYPIISKLKKGEAFVFKGDDDEYYIVRQVNVDRIKRFAKALSPTTLWASVKAYYETLKGGERKALMEAVVAIVILILVAVIAIAILKSITGGSVDADTLAKAIGQALKQQQNVTKVVVS
ncbi:MAG: hypothetical protein H0Z18_09175 [Thermococcus sp.]|uniref:hypothetical protein n=1 Tax=Thermococcus sp. TaxID=35749 RepID=UPI001D1F8168|nr:hypothetical protein [Thermococcus sp.]MBO8175415.1 hypothetical protein [Thermococcus sp.]